MTYFSPPDCKVTRVGLVLAVMIAPALASAADRVTCTMIEKVLETTDKGLEALAADPASPRTPSGVATFANEARNMAARNSARDPLPDEVIAALTAISEAASSQYSFADAAPALLEQGLIIQGAMTDICPGTKILDLRRHEK